MSALKNHRLPACHQIRTECFRHQMKMVAQPAIGVPLPIRLAASLSQSLAQVLAVPTVHHMVDRARILHS